MKYAIDRFTLGFEHEVAAESLMGEVIPRQHSRFFCPECDEPVDWRAKGSGEFYHKKKTSHTPECDLRVDGCSELSLHERIGLSMYLVHDHGEDYRLGILFPPLGERMLAVAAAQDVSIRILASGERREFQVNQSRFFPTQSTLLPVDIVPPPGQNYSLELCNAEMVYGLKQKWADYADAFDVGGALFHCNEHGGKKIRHGDSVSPGITYYLVTDSPGPFRWNEMQMTRMGMST